MAGAGASPTMTEKWAKKARVLFDPKEKEKYRYAALESILGTFKHFYTM